MRVDQSPAKVASGPSQWHWLKLSDPSMEEALHDVLRVFSPVAGSILGKELEPSFTIGRARLAWVAIHRGQNSDIGPF